MLHIPNAADENWSDFSKLCLFGSICSALQPSKLGTDPAGYKVLDLQSKLAYVARAVKVFDGKFLPTEENQIHCLRREEGPLSHSSSFEPTPARLEDSRDSLKGPEKEDLLQTSLI